jgi:hypothetical protein
VAEPAAAEYGLTAADVERATERILADHAADRAAGRTRVFTGRLPRDED